MKLSLVVLFSALTSVRADAIDDAVNAVMAKYKITGASFVYYNKNTSPDPIMRGYGKVSTQSNAAAVTPDTVFMLASVSKVFTGVMISLLIDQGKIASLDEDICDILPDEYNDDDNSACRNPRHRSSKISWRMFATHRTSMKEEVPPVRDVDGEFIEPSYGPADAYDGSATSTACPLTDTKGFYRDLLLDTPTTTNVGGGVTVQGNVELDWHDAAQENGTSWLSSKPGEVQEYSNLAMGYVAALLEHVVKDQTFACFSKTYLFDKLSMTNTAWFRRWDGQPDEECALPAGVVEAVPTYDDGEDVGHYCFIDYASGQLHSSISDLSKFLKSMVDDFGVAAIGWSQATGKANFECQERDADNNMVPADMCEFGVGFELLNNGLKPDNEYLAPLSDLDWTNGGVHEGSELGINTLIALLPSAGVYIAVMHNTEVDSEMSQNELVYDILAAAMSTQSNDSSETGDSTDEDSSGDTGFLASILGGALAFLTCSL